MQLLMLVEKLARKLSVQTCIRSQLGMSHVYSVAQQSAPGEGLHDKAGLHMMPTQVPFQAEVCGISVLGMYCGAHPEADSMSPSSGQHRSRLAASLQVDGRTKHNLTVLLHSVRNKPPVHWSLCHKAHLHGTYQHKIRLAVL